MNVQDGASDDRPQTTPEKVFPWLTGYWLPLLVLILTLHVEMAGYSSAIHSPTWDEVGHLVSGVYHLEVGDFDLYKVNPPIPRMIAAIPTVIYGHAPIKRIENRTAFPGRPEWQTGIAFLQDNPDHIVTYFMLGRWMLIPFSVCAALIIFLWSRELYGVTAGLVATLIWCIEPNSLANAAMYTPDLAASASGLFATYTFRRWLVSPGWKTALVSGGALGVAELCKSTWLVLLVLWPALWLIKWAFVKRRISKDFWQEFRQILVIGVIVVYLLNLGYAFESTCEPLETFTFVSRTLRGDGGSDVDGLPAGNRFKGTLLGKLPVPLPKNYVLGIDFQKREFESGGYDSYLMGELRGEGWWYYYLFAMFLKTPLGFISLLIIGCFSAWLFRREVDWFEQLLVLAVPISVIAFVSSQSGFTNHLRYVTIAYPFLFIWASQAVKFCAKPSSVASTIVYLSLAWGVSSSLSNFPHSLSYFNELTGGPSHAGKFIGCSRFDSTLDWGQNLLLLKDWLNEHRGVDLDGIASGGMYEFRNCIGLSMHTPPGEPKPGSYVVGAPDLFRPGSQWGYFKEFHPIARIGCTLFVYKIREEDVREYREKHRPMGQ